MNHYSIVVCYKGWGEFQYGRKEAKRHFGICAFIIEAKSNFGGVNINSPVFAQIAVIKAHFFFFLK